MTEKARHLRKLTSHAQVNSGFGFTDGLASYAQRVAYSDEALLVSLSNTLKLREHDLRWRSTWLGGFLAKFERKTDPDTIEIDGLRLYQLFETVGEDPGQRIDLGDHYAVDLDWFRTLLAQAAERVRQSADQQPQQTDLP